MTVQIANILIDSDSARQLLVRFAEKDKLFEFKELYNKTFDHAGEHEAQRCFYLIRLSKDLSMPY